MKKVTALLALLLALTMTVPASAVWIADMPEAIIAAGAVLYYLEYTEHRQTKHISSISRIDEDRFVWIDKFSIRNLELFSSSGQGCSLAEVLDKTFSPMGARMLRRWTGWQPPIFIQRRMGPRSVATRGLIF